MDDQIDHPFINYGGENEKEKYGGTLVVQVLLRICLLHCTEEIFYLEKIVSYNREIRK